MPTKQVLRHLHVETPRTNHRRKCAAHKTGKYAHPIVAGEPHLVITEADKTFRYCRQSAAQILERAHSDLEALTRELGI